VLALIVVYVVRGRGSHAVPELATPPARDAATVVVVADAAVKPDAAPASPASTFVGSTRCKDCHEKEYAAWKQSWHAHALAPGDRKSIVGDFKNARFTGTSSEAWMKRTGEVSTMRTRGPDGELADFRVDHVIGGKRMQDNVTVFPDGRWQVLPIYFHVTGHAWVDYTETKQGALTPEHPFYWTNSRRMANHECLDCHTTALRVDYDERARHWNTTFVDGSVACEDCHGPGSRHAESSEPEDIVQPVKSGEVGMSACARCHGPRKPLFPLLDPDHQFQLGERYDEMYEPIVVTMADGTSPDFFVDGKPKTSSFEYQAMLQAACYRKGGANCLTCHTAPHAEGHRKAELRVAPDETCRKCHAPVFAAGTAHTHHKSTTCIACHMPPIVSGVLDHFVDHAIDVPAPQNTARHGVPSACGVCHADKSPDELARWTDEHWPEARLRQARRVQLADAFDEATAKASAQPLLAVIGDAAEAPTLRGAAMITLARRFGPQTARAIKPLLASDDLVLRAKACEALATAKATADADALVPRLADPSLRVRLAAALALFDLHDRRGEPALQHLADDPASAHLMIPHLELGQALGGRGDFVGARRELEWVAKLAPYYADPLVQLAAVAAEQGDFKAARARVDQALQLEPKHRGALSLRDKLDQSRHVAPPAAPEQ
jgi:thioredoxin-like negative regulator of GroEL